MDGLLQLGTLLAASGGGDITRSPLLNMTRPRQSTFNRVTDMLGALTQGVGGLYEGYQKGRQEQQQSQIGEALKQAYMGFQPQMGGGQSRLAPMMGSTPPLPSGGAPQTQMPTFARLGGAGMGAGPGQSPLMAMTEPFARAVGNQESGGRYDIVGPASAKGDRPYGKYQVMGANLPQWAAEAGYPGITPQQFLKNPQAQEAIARTQMAKYLQQTGGDYQKAAMMWHGGPGYSPEKRDVLGMSTGQYGRDVAERMGQTPKPASLGSNQAQQYAALPPGQQMGVMSQFAQRLLTVAPNLTGAQFVQAMGEAAPWLRLDQEGLTKEHTLELNQLKEKNAEERTRIYEELGRLRTDIQERSSQRKATTEEKKLEAHEREVDKKITSGEKVAAGRQQLGEEKLAETRKARESREKIAAGRLEESKLSREDRNKIAQGKLDEVKLTREQRDRIAEGRLEESQAARAQRGEIAAGRQQLGEKKLTLSQQREADLQTHRQFNDTVKQGRLQLEQQKEEHKQLAQKQHFEILNQRLQIAQAHLVLAQQKAQRGGPGGVDKAAIQQVDAEIKAMQTEIGRIEKLKEKGATDQEVAQAQQQWNAKLQPLIEARRRLATAAPTQPAAAPMQAPAAARPPAPGGPEPGTPAVSPEQRQDYIGKAKAALQRYKDDPVKRQQVLEALKQYQIAPSEVQ